MKNMKRFKLAFSVILTFLLVFVFSIINVSADTVIDNNGVEYQVLGSAKNDSAEYILTENVQDETLEFGLSYRYDKALVNTTASADITGDMNAAGGGAYKSSGKMLANTYYPTDVRLFQISPELGVEIVPWVKFKNSNWGLNTVLSMAADYESSHPGRKVIGAINGDFFDINSKNNCNYTSSGGTVGDGNYYKVSSSYKSIGFKDGTLKGNILPTVSDKPIIEVFDEKGNVLYKSNIEGINVDPVGETTTVFMAFWDENHKAIPQDVSDAYVIDATKLVPFTQSSIYGLGKLNGQTSATLDKKTFAIKTNDAALKAVLNDKVTIRVQYTYTDDLEGYDNVIAYGQNLLLDGECVAGSDYRHPRTIVGVKEDGTIVLAEIDGRQPNINCYGATLKELAALMKYYGCVDAFNLDGGGSSTICIIQDGALTVQNSTSDGSPRSDSNCLLIVAKVPVLEINAGDIETNEFSITISVVEMIETYKDLYIQVNSDNEFKKVVSGQKMVIKGLEKNTKYNYQLFSKIGNEYCMIPYSGAVNTAKEHYVLSSMAIKIVEESGEKYYQVTYDMQDPQTTLITTVIIINGKRYYAKNNMFSIPASAFSPLSSSSELQISHNRNNLLGNVIDKSPVNATVEDSEVLFDATIDEVACLINELFK